MRDTVLLSYKLKMFSMADKVVQNNENRNWTSIKQTRLKHVKAKQNTSAAEVRSEHWNKLYFKTASQMNWLIDHIKQKFLTELSLCHSFNTVWHFKI